MQPFVAQVAGRLHRSLHQLSDETKATGGRVNEQPLEFGDSFGIGPQRDAADRAILHFEQQNAIVFPGQASKFAVEGLAAEIDFDIGLVVPEKLAYRFHIFREAGCADDKLRVKWVQKPKIPFSN